MSVRSVTVDEVMLWGPCTNGPDPYTRERVTELFAGRERMTALDILGLDIPPQDRLWAALREELIPAPILHEFGCWCAEQVLRRERDAGREPDQRSWKAIDVKRRWIRGEASDEELDAAWNTSGDAASDAWADAEAAWNTSGAAASAAWDAARAAWAAARAAWAAARNAAGAAWVAARAASWDAQLRFLVGMLEDGNG